MKIDLVPIMEKIAMEHPARIVVCEGWDKRCLQATADILKRKLAKIILLGDPEIIRKKAEALGLNIEGAEIEDINRSSRKAELIDKLVDARKHKGMTKEQAAKMIEEVHYYGCMFAKAGYADGVAGSAIGSTAELMRPALQILREKGRIVSEVGILDDVKNDRTMFESDGSLNINPDSVDLSQIAINAAHVVRSFGIEPKIAMLSFSTKGSGGHGPIVELAREATAIVRKKDPSLIIDGELQVDAAVSPYAAKRKCPNSPIKGDANTLIFPNLTAANIFMHGMMQFSEMKFEFTIIEGLTKPVGIVGRSTPWEMVRNITVSCAMQVNTKRKEGQ
jgi:phosphate acetyltransferase